MFRWNTERCLQNRPWDAIPYFMRAISVDPDLPEAICGLANSRNAICDWVGRGALDSDLGVDDAGFMIVSAYGTDGRAGYLHRVADITKEQLRSSYLNNVGLVSSLGNLDYWMGWVEKALDEPLTGSTRARWRKLFRRFFAAFDRAEKRVNEGGFVVRFAEWLARRLQYHAYRNTWGHIVSTDMHCSPLTPNDLVHYPRFPVSPFWDFGVTSVLPFHTVSPVPPLPIPYSSRYLPVLLPDGSAHDPTYCTSTCPAHLCQRALSILAAEIHISSPDPPVPEDQYRLRI